MFSKHITRFLTIIAIVLISMGISAGLGEVEDKINTALTNYYQEQNIPDFVVKSTSLLGFSSADIDAIEAEYGSAGFAKNMFDLMNICMTFIIGIVSGYFLLGIGIGTVFAVIGVGRAVAAFNYLCKEKMDVLAGISEETVSEAEVCTE